MIKSKTKSQSSKFLGLFLSLAGLGLYTTSSYAFPGACQGAEGRFVYNFDAKSQTYIKGGFVARTASVPLKNRTLNGLKIEVTKHVFIGENTQICGQAKIRNHAIIKDQAIVRDHTEVRNYAIIAGFANVSHYAVIKDHASVTEYGQVKGRVILKDFAKVRGHAIASANSVIEHFAVLEGYATLSDQSLMQNMAFCSGKANLNGTTILRESAAIVGKIYTQGIVDIHGRCTIKDNRRLLGRTDFHGFNKRRLSDTPLEVYDDPQNPDSTLEIHPRYSPDKITQEVQTTINSMTQEEKESDTFCVCMRASATEGDESGLTQLSHLKCNLPCGHEFHRECLLEWIKQSKNQDITCPNCRTPISNSRLP
ncbi:MAG: RING finger domain-containing protein [Oligoflexales bacterium]